MFVAFSEENGVFVKFEPTELAEACVFVEALQKATGSKDVQRVVDAVRLRLAGPALKEPEHTCTRCTKPILPLQMSVVDEVGFHHAYCPKGMMYE